LGWFGFSFLFVGNLLSELRSYGAGILTVLSNRIGDVALLMVITWIINFGSWSFIYYCIFYQFL
jgi:NADH-ubiquinone oxidoreductase chain 5